MKTEARKLFDHSFVLTEQELRRIVDVARQQLEKAGVADAIESLEVKFKNGTISDIGSLDELLSLENVGSKEVIRLDIRLAEKSERIMADHFIELQFRNAAEDDDPRPISYNLRGTERDWVFVTASELDERIAKIKSHAPRRIRTSRSSFFRPPSLLFLVGMTVGLFLALWMFRTPRSPSAAESIESQWKAGTLRDPVEAIIIQQKAYEKERALLNPRYFLLLVFGIPIAFVVTGELLLPLLYYLYPAYVFSWGDKTKLYERRVRIRGYVFSGIVGTLIIGIIAGIIANRLTSPK